MDDGCLGRQARLMITSCRVIIVQWNPFNMGTKGTCQNVHIIGVYVVMHDCSSCSQALIDQTLEKLNLSTFQIFMLQKSANFVEFRLHDFFTILQSGTTCSKGG